MIQTVSIYINDMIQIVSIYINESLSEKIRKTSIHARRFIVHIKSNEFQ
jgi:hypothetical protein